MAEFRKKTNWHVCCEGVLWLMLHQQRNCLLARLLYEVCAGSRELAIGLLC